MERHSTQNRTKKTEHTKHKQHIQDKKTNIKRIITKHKTINQNIIKSKRHKANSTETMRLTVL